MVHSDSMSPASLGICEKLFRRWLKTSLKTSLTEGSARRSHVPNRPSQCHVWVCQTSLQSFGPTLTASSGSFPPSDILPQVAIPGTFHVPIARVLFQGLAIVEAPHDCYPNHIATQTTLHRPLMDLPAGGEPTFLLEGGPRRAQACRISFRAEPGRVPWAKTRPPGARLRAPTPGLAPGWGPGNANPGDVLAEMCQSGYKDALRFLEENNLLIMEHPTSGPALSESPPNSCCKNTETTKEWVFRRLRLLRKEHWWMDEQLALPTPIKKVFCQACQDKPGLYAKVSEMLPVRVASYMLMPYTLPVQSAYSVAQRFVEWIPEVPADVRWLIGVAGDVYRTAWKGTPTSSI
ncbi:hypothetical protein L3Q82_009643, partial [Scortum barcoo]